MSASTSAERSLRRNKKGAALRPLFFAPSGKRPRICRRPTQVGAMGWKNAGLPHPAPDPRDHIAQRAMRPGRHDPEHDPAEQRVSARQRVGRSEEHTSELQSLMRISYAVFCLKKKKSIQKTDTTT